MIKRAAAALFAGALLVSCGYKVLGYNPDKPVRFYIERVRNNTINFEFGEIVQQTADEYFIKYGEMSSYDRATYILAISLNSVRFSADITTETDEAVTTKSDLELQIIVLDKDGREVFGETYKPSETFAVASTISPSLKNRRAAIKTAVQSALENFRNAFNSTVAGK